jgi:hypothetical protein
LFWPFTEFSLYQGLASYLAKATNYWLLTGLRSGESDWKEVLLEDNGNKLAKILASGLLIVIIASKFLTIRFIVRAVNFNGISHP